MNQARAADPKTSFDKASKILFEAVQSGQVKSAALVARVGTHKFEQAFGDANIDSSFLLGSISKPIAIAAVMKLYEAKAFSLDDPASKYLPEFKGDGREQVTMRHLMTHVSGLPDQLPENMQLRRSHATLEEFAQAAMKTPLHFAPGSKYEYSSMAILLATEIARRLTGKSILDLVEANVTKPLGLKHTALGIGALLPEQRVPMQIEHAAPEAGGGDPTAKQWDWNSSYWRALGAPWGGVHASAGDVLQFLGAFVAPPNDFLSQETTALMIRDHNESVRIPRGLGFARGPITIGAGVSATAFGHSGSTGTLAWMDLDRDCGFVVLTSLPATAVKPHPRDLASNCFTT